MKNLPISTINRMKYIKYYKPLHYKLIILGDSFTSAYFNSIYKKYLKINNYETLILTNNPIIENKVFWSQYIINNCEKVDFRDPYLKFHYDDTYNFEDIYDLNTDSNEIKLVDGRVWTYDYLLLSQDPMHNVNNNLYEEFVNELSNIYSNFNLETSDILRSRLSSNLKEDSIVIFKECDKLDNFENSVNLSFLLKQKYPKSEINWIIKGNKLSNKENLNNILIDLLKTKNINVIFFEGEHNIDFKNDLIKFNNNCINYDILIFDPKREYPYYFNKDLLMNRKSNFQSSISDNVFVSNDNYEFSHSNMRKKIEECRLFTRNINQFILKDWELTDKPTFVDPEQKDSYFLFYKKNQIIKINETSNSQYKLTKLNKWFNYYYYINIEMYRYQRLMMKKRLYNKKSRFVTEQKYFYFN